MFHTQLLPNNPFDEIYQCDFLDGMVGVHRVHIARAAENTEVQIQAQGCESHWPLQKSVAISDQKCFQGTAGTSIALAQYFRRYRCLQHVRGLQTPFKYNGIYTFNSFRHSVI